MTSTIIIPGRIGQDATTKDVGDTTVTEFSVADDQRVKGEKVTVWWKCAMWGERGEKLAQYLTKGSAICVTGTPSFRPYDKDGETRVSAECRVADVTLLGKPDSGNGTPRQTAPQPTRRDPPPATNFDSEPFADDIQFISSRGTF